MRRRFYVEAVVAGLLAVLTVVTLISADWIEVVFGVDPDGGNGSLEWALVAVLAVASAALSLTAWRERARSLSITSAGPPGHDPEPV
jgi:hypothetical protein